MLGSLAAFSVLDGVGDELARIRKPFVLWIQHV
jgi:hypothetical protein